MWVDDVVSCAEGETAQNEILEVIANFAIKHKIKWGNDKCNVMRIGKHKKSGETWKAGEMEIEETTKYKYLGDIISNDGKNMENIKSRKMKMNAATIFVNTIAAGEVMRGIEAAFMKQLPSLASSLMQNPGVSIKVKKRKLKR